MLRKSYVSKIVRLKTMTESIQTVCSLLLLRYIILVLCSKLILRVRMSPSKHHNHNPKPNPANKPNISFVLPCCQTFLSPHPPLPPTSDVSLIYFSDQGRRSNQTSGPQNGQAALFRQGGPRLNFVFHRIL